MARIYIDTDELRALADAVRSTAGDIGGVNVGLARAWGPAFPPPIDLVWQRSRSAGVEARSAGTATQLWLQAAQLDIHAASVDTEQSIGRQIRSFLGRGPWWLKVAGVGIWPGFPLGGALTAGASIQLQSLQGALRGIRSNVLGDPVYCDRGIDPTWGHQRSMADYLATVDRLQPGEIAVIRVSEDRYVVVLRGIDGLLLSPTPNDWLDAGFGMLGGESPYEKAVKRALEDARVPQGSRIMLIGHSQGGITAVNLAADSDFQKQYNVTHVVAAGSPVTNLIGRVPPYTRVLSVENRWDLVPHIDEQLKVSAGVTPTTANHMVHTYFGNPAEHGIWQHDAGGYAKELARTQGDSSGRGTDLSRFFASSDAYYGNPSPEAHIYQFGDGR